MRTADPTPGRSVGSRLLVGQAICILCSSISAAEPQNPTAAQPPPIKEISPGLFEIGKVRLNKNDATVTVPAVVNMSEGLVEYLLVNSTGKTHESAFRTDAEPYHVQLAMLLLGARGKGTNDFPQENVKPPPGDPVTIEVLWKSPGKQIRIRAEDLILDRDAGKKMQRVKWIYNGSQINPEGFAAQQSGSIISLIDDPDALINNPLPRRDDNDNWQIRRNVIHKLDSAAEVVITLAQPKSQK